jgi:hypothetical protein
LPPVKPTGAQAERKAEKPSIGRRGMAMLSADTDIVFTPKRMKRVNAEGVPRKLEVVEPWIRAEAHGIASGSQSSL